jgi:hypothetical protein
VDVEGEGSVWSFETPVRQAHRLLRTNGADYPFILRRD